MNAQTRIVVTKQEVSVKEGRSGRTGKDYSIREQAASLDGPRFRMPVSLTLGDKQEPYAPGVYEIDFDASIAVGRFGTIGWERSLVLHKVAELPKKAA